MRQSRHALDEQADVTAGAGRRVGQERRRSGLDPASGDILDLQASAGNGAIAKLLAGGPGATAGTNGAPLRLQRAVTSPPVVQREAGPPLLRVGSVGSEVVDLQAALNSAGVARPPLVTDGQFGGGTRSAVVALQRGAGIAPDGIVGPDTRAALAMHGGQGHGSAEETELGQRISAAVEGQVGAAGTAVGAAGTAAGAAGTAAGTPKGVSGELTTGPVSGSGSYDAGTGEASGAVSTRNGSASGSYNTDTGSGSGSVSTGSTTASGSYDAGTGEASGAVSTRNGSASGSYNTDTGSGSGSVSTGSTTASGAWDAGSHTASGQVTTASGTSASGTYNADSGTGAGSVHTSYGDAGVSVDDTTVHASVSVPGVGDVTVNVDRPDWL